MFRFKLSCTIYCTTCNIISIHHMFRFKNNYEVLKKGKIVISIHHMFRFKHINFLKYKKLKHFNTSYVSVQAIKNQTEVVISEFQYIICFGSSLRSKRELFKVSVISIHHMFRFKLNITFCQSNITLFQYIICFGSRF